MTTGSVNIARNRIFWVVVRVAVTGVLAWAVGPLAQEKSKDRDHPTPLTSPEISGFIDQTVLGDYYYYSVTAGPGEVTFTFNVESGAGGVANVGFALFDVNSKQVFDTLVQSAEGANE